MLRDFARILDTVVITLDLHISILAYVKLHRLLIDGDNADPHDDPVAWGRTAAIGNGTYSL